jgi:outer membrane protein TolC
MTFAEEPVRPVEDLITDALANRPEMQSSRINLKNDEINKKGARNALLPTLDLVAFYQGAGLGGNTLNCSIVNGQRVCTPVSSVGYGSTLGDTFGSVNPDKGIGLQLTIPIRNRAAQATQIRSELEYRQAEMLMQQQANQIAIQVRNAAFAVQQNRARVDAARAAGTLATQSLDAEQKKYALGASTSFNVLQAQRDLIQAETNAVSAVTAYQKSRVQLDLVTANTLERNGIVLAEANTGVVTHTPRVPGVATATTVPQQ